MVNVNGRGWEKGMKLMVRLLWLGFLDGLIWFLNCGCIVVN